ncbi:HeH/LEM domain-containing protein [Herbaspirillum frisingense]|uniref:HeH/LEM domain-containing protein n=1 Tax=Herbaspirillum frisingense TaxID=92645 RepID=A0ABU1PI66_9BURK|nr:HeH/LEM domain-containing protein [Herbaspirillum frisingense]MDR6585532.1 hypothetical protein [Herbaspirillum frisingense]
MNMRVFAKAFEGVRDGEIYPTQFAKGDECPPELEAGALALGALERSIDEMTIPQLKVALDELKAPYAQNAKKEDLVELLKAAEQSKVVEAT